MSSPRRSRGVFLTGLILILVALYYYDFFGLLVERDGDEGRHQITPPSKDAGQHAVPDEQTSSLKLSDTSSTAIHTDPVSSQPTTSALEVVPTPTSTHSAPQQAHKGAGAPEDVLLIFKTGASTIWRRMPLHLTTTLSNGRIPHSVIYSDLPEQLSSTISAIDVLTNSSSIIQKFDPSAYAAYQDQQSPSHLNTYREHARLPGDEPPDATAGNQPGWLLDKYKFLPMLAHAQRNWPNLKWYIYIEDDTFIFWDNVLSYLSTLEPDDEPSYYGAYSGEGNNTFAQGGSGLVFSRSLMSAVFSGDNIPDLEKYGNETSQSCCGDIMLGKVLRDYGVYVNRGTYGTGSFRPEPPWKTGFDDWSWCAPVFTFHHLHQRDILQLSELERKRRALDAGRPVIFRDVYMELIAPYLTKPKLTNWDNFASRYVFGSNATDPVEEDLNSIDHAVLEAAPSSAEACRKACLAIPNCMGWRHDSANEKCGMDTVVKLGREPDPQPHWEAKTVITSGWILERIDDVLLKETCKVVKDP
ncbi:uncharacterized protein LY89DRAFT_690100 [Mollisia scopiformis]|uniref:Glycosyltransferase family 31 protein n=1 Tax=Mollisia scopiformis TaxID=149040 RepID=A0A132BB59_MOLSC|nr:uncharacterized protein LY89DRAFT_690100 [Mollisia scopiformis]KUJ09645.1 hypothetical protein LY89DRAFT_690100 [Mollisia scopiformis]